MRKIICVKCGDSCLANKKRAKYCSLECSRQARTDDTLATIDRAKANVEALPRSQKEAQALNVAHYFGDPCRQGHVGIRVKNNRACAECARERVRQATAYKPKRVAKVSLSMSATFFHILPNWQPVVEHA